MESLKPSFDAASAAAHKYAESFGSLTHLDELLQVQLQKFLGDVSRKPVMLRCEALPAVAGDRRALSEVFGDLFALILEDLPAGTNWYLHVTCREEKDEVYTTREGWIKYKIQFHTNLKATAAWKARALVRLKAINATWGEHKWMLKLDEARYAGRLFSVSLPGKLT